MLVSFFESIKYVGHLLPISFLRIFLGYFYFMDGINKFSNDFLIRPEIAAQISEWLPSSQAPDWYKISFNLYVIPHWQSLAFIVLALQLTIGVSYLIGFAVRPTAILAAILTFNLLYFSGPQFETLLKTFLAIHLVFAWVGAGRSLGFDYYFYKTRRGFWW